MTDETKGEHDHIVEAGKWARGLHANPDGSPLTELQHAAIFAAQVRAVIDGKFEPPEAEATPEPEAAPEPAPAQEPAP